MKSKLMKKLVAIATSAALVLGLAVGVSAIETDTVTVKVNIQRVDRTQYADLDGDGIEEPMVTVLTQQAIEVPSTSNATLNQVVESMENISSANVTNVDWETVNVYDSNYNVIGSAQALTSLKYGSTLLDDWYNYPTANSYEGESWMWFYGSPSDMPEDGANYRTENYPTDYLSQVTVSQLPNATANGAGVYEFTLSFEKDSMSW